MAPADLDIAVPAGRLRAWAFGPEDGPLVVGVPGLTANSREFAAIGPALAAHGRRFVALDLRGRGHSEVTGPGTYGWAAHARDVADAAARLGAARFDVVGHSMGAFVGLQLARDTPTAVGRLVLVDALGAPDQDALVPVLAALERLGRRSTSADAHVAGVRAGGAVVPWSPLWEDSYRYEVTVTDDGVVSRTDRDAVLEDVAWAAEHPARELWSGVGGPVLLVRATVAFGPDGGTIVTAADRDAFLATHPEAQVLEVDANHYGVIEHPDAVAAIAAFLGGDVSPGSARG